MWFAAFQNYQQNPWLFHLAGKMLINDPIIDSLLLKNPFRGQNPPTYVRAKHYKYNFSKLGFSKSGQWWTRKFVGNYLPSLDLNSVKQVCDQFGWKLKSQ